MSEVTVDRAAQLLMMKQQLSTRGGRDFVWHCLTHTRLFYNTFTADANMHSYNAGKRSHGLWLELELKEASPGDYLKMITENYNG